MLSVKIAVVAGAMAITGACVSSQSVRGAGLEGPIWKLVEMDGLAVATPLERPFVVSFGNDRQVRGQACNRLGGEYRMAQQQLIVGPIAMTEISCGELFDRLESRFLQILSRPVNYHLAQNGGLVLGHPDRPLARFLPTIQ